MLTLFRLSLTIFILTGTVTLTTNSYSQEKSSTTKQAAEDYEAYKNSPFSAREWDPLVKEGFEAMDREDMQTSIEFLRKAANLGCQSPIVFFKLALGYESQGSYYSAIQYYELALGTFKTANKEHRYWKSFDENYGRALYMMGETNKAIPILEKAASSSTTPWVLKLLGQHYLSQKDQLKATAYFERLMQAEDHGLTVEEQLQINIDLARLYVAQNEEEAAKRYYERVLQLDPNNREARDFVNKGERGETFEKLLEMMDK